MFERGGGVSIYYEEHGQGFPLVLFAPGGMRSSAAVWQRAPYHPIREFANDFRVIAMDQRNAGQSVAPIGPGDGWHIYSADQLALLDHLGVSQCHVLGGCIGGAFCLGLLHAAPGRIASAVLQQPIGSSPDNRAVFYALFDDWAKEIAPRHPNVAPEAWQAFRERMYGGDFVFNVSPEFVRSIEAPLLVLMGDDIYHPSATSRQIAALAPHAQLVERWKEAELVPETVRTVREFLIAHTPPERR
jgi:pimeloyl-ACP methyl ester carboxylesterase